MKAYVVRAEDARLLGDMPMVRKLYYELHTLNRRLVGEYAKRANNHRVSQRDMYSKVTTHTRGCVSRVPDVEPDVEPDLVVDGHSKGCCFFWGGFGQCP